MRSRDQLIVALDASTAARAMAVARRLRGVVRTVKVGSILFTAGGPSVIQRLRTMGFHIMLDLKFHDIPSTVERSCRAAVRHRVSMLTVHASGGRAMLEAAVQGVRSEAKRLRRRPPLVLGVTTLTSIAERRGRSAREVVRLAGDALQAGCDGVVSSAQEADRLRRRFGRRLRIVCPGIRPAGTRAGDSSTRFARSGSSRAKSRDDQRRIATPADAMRRGADVLVVGRPITEARNPRAAAYELLKAIEASEAC
jgi:orotidine-5'-phosphate decarboxylase